MPTSVSVVAFAIPYPKTSEVCLNTCDGFMVSQLPRLQSHPRTWFPNNSPPKTQLINSIVEQLYQKRIIITNEKLLLCCLFLLPFFNFDFLSTSCGLKSLAGWKTSFDICCRFQGNSQGLGRWREVYRVSQDLHLLRQCQTSLCQHSLSLGQICLLPDMWVGVQEQKCVERTHENQTWSVPTTAH